jgi:hypothetical protein
MRQLCPNLERQCSSFYSPAYKLRAMPSFDAIVMVRIVI